MTLLNEVTVTPTATSATCPVTQCRPYLIKIRSIFSRVFLGPRHNLPQSSIKYQSSIFLRTRPARWRWQKRSCRVQEGDGWIRQSWQTADVTLRHRLALKRFYSSIACCSSQSDVNEFFSPATFPQAAHSELSLNKCQKDKRPLAPFVIVWIRQIKNLIQ